MAPDVLNTANYLIAIGGSAGSLDVLLQLLPDLLLPPGTAAVIVLHRKNDSDSLLTLLLGTKSAYPVEEAEDKMPIHGGRVYIAPADYHLLIEDTGTFSLDDSEKVNYSRPSIDVTLETAAHAYGPHLLCLLLSGANADGTEGLRSVKYQGGITAVQSPESAIVPFMPQHAIDHMQPAHVVGKDHIASFLKQARP